MMQKEHANTNDDVVPFLGFTTSECLHASSVHFFSTQSKGRVDVSEITRADL